MMAKASTCHEYSRVVVQKMFDETTREEFIRFWEGIASSLNEQNVAFHVPLLVVCGSKDQTGTVRLHMKDWKKYYLNAIVQEIPDAAHVANLDSPEHFNSIMTEFIHNCDSHQAPSINGMSSASP